MTTLIDYAETHFPNHTTEASSDVTLTSHTAVARVLGASNARALEQRVKAEVPNANVGVVLVRPTDPTVVKNGGEDPEGVFDLPKRRIATSGIIVGVIVGALVGVLVGLITESTAAPIIVGVFAAVIGGAMGAMFGGGARYGGHRAWEQTNAPDRTVGLVAAFMDDEASATRVASLMEATEPEDVRILAADGAWHSPHT